MTPRWSVIAKGTFKLLPSRVAVPLAKQPPLAMTDVPPDGETALLAARYESDFVPFKPRADCLCVGTAHPPGGAAPWCVVSFGVGRYFEKKILVVGDRKWVPRGEQHVGATQPAMFKSMPLTFANAYGGQDLTANDATAFFAHNPSGKGYAVSGQTVIGRPLPNLEDPARQLRAWTERVEPRAFGPVGRTWQPRLGRAGTFGDDWQRERAPLPPVDFSDRYYNAAPDDQQVEQYLRGDEDVRLTNLHPTHNYLSCHLPGLRLRALVASDGSEGRGEISLREVKVNLDTLWVDADALRLVLIWRARIDPRAGDARVLLVQEHVDDAPPSPEIYRPLLLALDSEAAEAARLEAELDREEPDEEERGTIEEHEECGLAAL
jgi:hypothetical protein